MKIILKDESTKALGHKVEQVVSSVLSKIDGGELVEGYKLDAEILVNLKVKGHDELNLIFTDRMIMGKPEIFTVIPEFDETGALIGTQDNKDVTFEDVAQCLSRELPTEAVESVYNEEDLSYIDSVKAGDIEEKRYNHADGYIVVRYYRDSVGLVGELSATPKEQAETE